MAELARLSPRARLLLMRDSLGWPNTKIQTLALRLGQHRRWHEPERYRSIRTAMATDSSKTSLQPAVLLQRSNDVLDATARLILDGIKLLSVWEFIHRH
jgi:hypothetical protein